MTDEISVNCSGVAYWFVRSQACACNEFVMATGGGGELDGSANVVHDKISGGTTTSGVALVRDSRLYEDFVICYPLDETTGYIHYDKVRGLNSTARYSYKTYFHCVPATELKNNCYCELPLDDHTGPFTISMWGNFTTNYLARSFFSRGGILSFGHSHMGHLQAIMIDADGEEHNVFSDDVLEENRWYHLAATWDGSTLTLFVNGEEVGSEEITSFATPTGANYIGRWREGNITADLSEIRLVGGAMSAAYLRAEWANSCGELVMVA